MMNHYTTPSTYTEDTEDQNNSKYEMKELMFKLLVVGDYGVEALPCRSDDVILSSSDESDLAPIHKRVRTLSDSE
ncbi:hypothetical protein TNCV_3633001 [Trichonephila clavipes]|nr:hypothetical protein TNCV_3633001 [Trichonephila clavipes]